MASLLGDLLHEELALRWEQLLLDDAFTGGAMAWVPGGTPGEGQLVFPEGGALDKLCILSCQAGGRGALGMVSGQDVGGLRGPELTHFSLVRGPGFQEVSVTPGGDPQALGDPGHIQLRGPVRQVVTRTVQGECESLGHLPSPLLPSLAD